MTAAVVHFFIEIQESTDPCENNEAENNLGNLQMILFNFNFRLNFQIIAYKLIFYIEEKLSITRQFY